MALRVGATNLPSEPEILRNRNGIDIKTENAFLTVNLKSWLEPNVAAATFLTGTSDGLEEYKIRVNQGNFNSNEFELRNRGPNRNIYNVHLRFREKLMFEWFPYNVYALTCELELSGSVVVETAQSSNNSFAIPQSSSSGTSYSHQINENDICGLRNVLQLLSNKLGNSSSHCLHYNHSDENFICGKKYSLCIPNPPALGKEEPHHYTSFVGIRTAMFGHKLDGVIPNSHAVFVEREKSDEEDTTIPIVYYPRVYIRFLRIDPVLTKLFKFYLAYFAIWFLAFFSYRSDTDNNTFQQVVVGVIITVVIGSSTMIDTNSARELLFFTVGVMLLVLTVAPDLTGVIYAPLAMLLWPIISSILYYFWLKHYLVFGEQFILYKKQPGRHKAVLNKDLGLVTESILNKFQGSEKREVTLVTIPLSKILWRLWTDCYGQRTSEIEVEKPSTVTVSPIPHQENMNSELNDGNCLCDAV